MDFLSLNPCLKIGDKSTTFALNFGPHCLRMVVIAAPAFTAAPDSNLLSGLKSWDRYKRSFFSTRETHGNTMPSGMCMARLGGCNPPLISW
jgi:hypothetical protein